MANIATSIALITKYSENGFDKVYKKDACSSILAKDSSLVQFTGTKTVKVAKLSFGGLHDYNRNNLGDGRIGYDANGGYQGSMAGLTWEERTLTMDRAAKYVIEEFDNEESGDIVIGNALTEINRTQIVPEVDAYCFSKIYQEAGKKETAMIKVTDNNHVSSSGSYDGPIATLNAGFLWLDEHEVPAEKQVIFVSPAYLYSLRNSPELTKFMTQGDYSKDVSFTLTSYEGRKLVVVPPSRFKTAFDFGGGYFAPANGAKDIDFIIMPEDAAVHIVKFQKTRILSGDAATAMSNMDGYVLLARIYHDVIVFDNKKVAIYAHSDAANQGAGSVPASSAANSVTITQSSGHVLLDVACYPGEKFRVLFQGVAGLSAYDDGDAVSLSTMLADTTNVTRLELGDTIGSTTTENTTTENTVYVWTPKKGVSTDGVIELHVAPTAFITK